MLLGPLVGLQHLYCFFNPRQRDPQVFLETTSKGLKMTDTEPTVFLLGSDPDVGTAVVYQCQKTWDDLHAFGHDDVRYCDSCKQAVYQVIDVEGYQRAVAQRRCVMAEGRSVKGGEPAMFVGKPGAQHYRVESA